MVKQHKCKERGSNTIYLNRNFYLICCTITNFFVVVVAVYLQKQNKESKFICIFFVKVGYTSCSGKRGVFGTKIALKSYFYKHALSLFIVFVAEHFMRNKKKVELKYFVTLLFRYYLSQLPCLRATINTFIPNT